VPSREKPPTFDKPAPKAHYLSFGTGVKLMSEEWYIKALEGQMSKTGFRSFLKVLGVPSLEIGNNRYIDMLRFEIAMSSILRIGQPNFLAPGAKSLKYSNRDPDAVLEADVEHLQKHYRQIAGELLMAKRVAGAEMSYRTRDLVKKAARNLQKAAVHTLPKIAQERYAKRYAKKVQE
jgi:hypothetical protein